MRLVPGKPEDLRLQKELTLFLLPSTLIPWEMAKKISSIRRAALELSPFIQPVLDKHTYLHPFYDYAELILKVYEKQLVHYGEFLPMFFGYFTILWAGLDIETQLALELLVLKRILAQLALYRTRIGTDQTYKVFDGLVIQHLAHHYQRKMKPVVSDEGKSAAELGAYT